MVTETIMVNLPQVSILQGKVVENMANPKAQKGRSECPRLKTYSQSFSEPPTPPKGVFSESKFS